MDNMVSSGRKARQQNIDRWNSFKESADIDKFKEVQHSCNQQYMGEYDSDYVISGDEEASKASPQKEASVRRKLRQRRNTLKPELVEAP